MDDKKIKIVTDEGTLEYKGGTLHESDDQLNPDEETVGPLTEDEETARKVDEAIAAYNDQHAADDIQSHPRDREAQDYADGDDDSGVADAGDISPGVDIDDDNANGSRKGKRKLKIDGSYIDTAHKRPKTFKGILDYATSIVHHGYVAQQQKDEPITALKSKLETEVLAHKQFTVNARGEIIDLVMGRVTAVIHASRAVLSTGTASVGAAAFAEINQSSFLHTIKPSDANVKAMVEWITEHLCTHVVDQMEDYLNEKFLGNSLFIKDEKWMPQKSGGVTQFIEDEHGVVICAIRLIVAALTRFKCGLPPPSPLLHSILVSTPDFKGKPSPSKTRGWADPRPRSTEVQLQYRDVYMRALYQVYRAFQFREVHPLGFGLHDIRTEMFRGWLRYIDTTSALNRREVAIIVYLTDKMAVAGELVGTLKGMVPEASVVCATHELVAALRCGMFKKKARKLDASYDKLFEKMRLKSFLNLGEKSVGEKVDHRAKICYLAPAGLFVAKNFGFNATKLDAIRTSIALDTVIDTSAKENQLEEEVLKKAAIKVARDLSDQLDLKVVQTLSYTKQNSGAPTSLLISILASVSKDGIEYFKTKHPGMKARESLAAAWRDAPDIYEDGDKRPPSIVQIIDITTPLPPPVAPPAAPAAAPFTLSNDMKHHPITYLGLVPSDISVSSTDTKHSTKEAEFDAWAKQVVSDDPGPLGQSVFKRPMRKQTAKATLPTPPTPVPAAGTIFRPYDS